MARLLCDYKNYCSLDPASNRDDPHKVKTNVRIAVDKTVSANLARAILAAKAPYASDKLTSGAL
jgi:hypothetical protein